jgi:hypothetical protein
MRWETATLVVSVLATALALPSLFGGCQGSRSNGNGSLAADRAGAGKGGGIPAVRALDDPANPYAKQYLALDRWTWEHQVGVYRGRQPFPRQPGTKGEAKMITLVDEAGFMLPYATYVRSREEAKRDRTEDSFYSQSMFLLAAGAMDQAMIDDGHRTADLITGGFYLPVPDWLVADPPVSAMLLPNGEVVTEGPLGSGAEDGSGTQLDPGAGKAKGCCGGSDLGYFRYARDGQLIRSTKKSWWDLYYDSEVEGGYPPGNMTIRGDGYVVFKDDGGAVLSAYDYDGSPLGAIDPRPRDIHGFSALRPPHIRALYGAQQELAGVKGAAGVPDGATGREEGSTDSAREASS